MRIGLIIGLFAFSAIVQASSTLRIGNQVLTAGDSATRVTALLGKPSYKSRSRSTRQRSGRSRHRRGSRNRAAGEHWQYRRGDHVTTVTIVDGTVIDIEDHRF
ncbi:MAG: DUF2845 domain-containing protein [Rhodanobacter sp.]|nr:MAG: DUF2845 domain-containing protein [Rhodanobacter sp.]